MKGGQCSSFLCVRTAICVFLVEDKIRDPQFLFFFRNSFQSLLLKHSLVHQPLRRPRFAHWPLCFSVLVSPALEPCSFPKKVTTLPPCLASFTELNKPTRIAPSHLLLPSDNNPSTVRGSRIGTRTQFIDSLHLFILRYSQTNFCYSKISHWKVSRLLALPASGQQVVNASKSCSSTHAPLVFRKMTEPTLITNVSRQLWVNMIVRWQVNFEVHPVNELFKNYY